MRLLEAIKERLPIFADAPRRRSSGTASTPVLKFEPPVRLQTPERAGAVRGFAGADVNNLTYGWFSNDVPIDGLLRSQLVRLRARSRERFRNDPIVQGFCRALLSNVVGTRGLQLRAQAADSNGAPDVDLNKAVELAFSAWGKQCDVEHRLSMAELQRQAKISMLCDGEIILMHHVGRAYGDFGYQVRLIDAALLDVTYCAENIQGSNNQIIMGVEVDELRRPVAYHFLDSKSVDSYTANNGRRYQRIEASRVTHVFVPLFPGQTRGIPALTPALLRLKMLDAYQEAALANAIAGAMTMGFFERKEGAGFGGTGKSSDGSQVLEMEPATLHNLPVGTTFNAFDPAYPNGELPQFKKAMLRDIAAGLGLDYPTLGQDLEGVNLSSIRQANQESRYMYMCMQEWLGESMMAPVYLTWLPLALLRGKIRPGGRVSVAKQEKLETVRFRGRRWQSTDPLKDMNTMVLALRYRLRAPSSLAEDMGIDWEDELRRMQRDEEMMREAGLAWVGEPKMKGDSADQVGDEDKDDTGEDEGKEADGDE